MSIAEQQGTPAGDELARMLVARRLVDIEVLERVIEVAAQTGVSYDEILHSRGIVDPGQLRDLAAAAWQLPVLRDLPQQLDLEYIRRHPGQRYLAEHWMPVRRLADGPVMVATARQPDAALIEQVRTLLGAEPLFFAVSELQLRRALLHAYGDRIADEAANLLWARNPLLSARVVLSTAQRWFTGIGLLAIIGAAVLWPLGVTTALLATASLIFLAGTAFKFSVALRGAQYDVVERITPEQVAMLSDEDLPRYTLLVPVFHEANIVAKLIANLGRLDYPVDKLEIFVLVEEEDDETRTAIMQAAPPPHMTILTVPKGVPQTKPRACNVGLSFATGEFLTIYDAEDKPDPDQLKKAVLAFRRAGEATVCVQAALNYFNADENLLSRMFTLEYSYWFDYMLPGLDAGRLPIPLGGTSNHFRVRALQELGGWDPYNVTEDADLGIRAAALGYRVGVINSTTMEEANTSIPNFIRQRSRWIKGYMQTSLVHARAPLQLLRTIGPRGFLGFVLLIAFTPLTFLAVIPFTLLTIASILTPTEFLIAVFPPWLLWLCLLNFFVGSSLMVYLSMMGPYKRGTFGLIYWAILNPLYWLLHSFAAYKGLWQLITKPHYWEKTEHGLTSHDDD